MTNEFMQHVLHIQPGDRQSDWSLAGGGSKPRGQADWPDESLAEEKWPRWLRLAVAVGIGSSVWMFLLGEMIRFAV